MSPERLAIVTGATGAIGGAIAHGLAADGSFDVVLLGRDERRIRAVAEAIRQATGSDRVWHEVVDLSLASSIRDFAQRFDAPVDVLVNNAAVAPPRKQTTAEGRETVFATNVLGYLRLTLALESNLHRAAPARVVNVASYWAGDLDIDDLEFERRRYDNNTAYRQSKQANRMLTVALAERYSAREIVVNACHPGDVNSRLSNDLGFGGAESPEQGAATPLWMSTAHELEAASGKYFAAGHEELCRFAADRDGIARLFEACMRLGPIDVPAPLGRRMHA
jgi:NAD(P)-dependent dehydrogenase (short-subunit alcohol dehydrogenase family)